MLCIVTSTPVKLDQDKIINVPGHVLDSDCLFWSLNTDNSQRRIYIQVEISTCLGVLVPLLHYANPQALLTLLIHT